MDQNTFDRILDDLPRMTPTQRKDLTLRCGILGTTDVSGSDLQQTLREVNMAYAIHNACEREGCIQTSTFPPRPNHKLLPTFMAATQAVVGLLDFVDMTTTAERMAMRRVVTLVLVGMKERNIPLTYTSVLQQTAKASDYINRAFPGYPTVGLHVLIRGTEGQ